LPSCPRCNSDVNNPDARFCTQCGEPIREQQTPQEVGNATDPDFLVDEAHPVDQELVGDADSSPTVKMELTEAEASSIESDDDDGFMTAPLGSMPADDTFDTLPGFEPTGVPVAPVPEPADPCLEGTDFGSVGDESDQATASERLMASTGKEAEPEAGTLKVTANPDYLSPAEKDELLQQMGQIEPKRTEPGPTSPPPASFSPPATATSSDERKDRTPTYSGRALYFRNYIQLIGKHDLSENERFTLGNCEYVLKRRRFDMPLIIALGTPVLALLAVLLIPGLLPSSGAGEGRLIGMVIDEYNRPIGAGSTIQVRETGDTFETNADGFFVTSELDPGVYQVDFLFDGEAVGTAQATVVQDKVTTVTVRPSDDVVQELTQTSKSRSPSPRSTTSRSSRPASAGRSERRGTTTQAKAAAPGRIRLAANVNNAVLKLDGEPIGSGNITFRNIKPGTHRYEVSADGYETSQGSVTVGSGSTANLAVTLEALAQEQKQAEYTAEDFYYSGVAALREGDLAAAVTDLTEAIRLDPNFGDAYAARAEAYNGRQEVGPAHDDYIRAAEIFRFARQAKEAMSAYNNAMGAIADYESAVRIDENNSDAHFGLGKARYKRGNYDRAIENFERCRKLAPHNLAVYHYLMLAYVANNDTKKVKRTYDQFADVATENDITELRNDPNYAAVVRIVDTN
jgi:tetratricopeptide (TPR) repeat protein